uniref:EF-hand domain-containing protein n=1 Tax=Spongospora subterranea TaxID=70186 RepID=A0A0H5R644_9EUKA|eukprot:CRZ09306.1 hypothetical protein [Spongospora subterranea]
MIDSDLPTLNSHLTDLLLRANQSSPRRRCMNLAVEFAQDARDGHSAQLTPRSDKSTSSATRFMRNRTCTNLRRIVAIAFVCLVFFEPVCTACESTPYYITILEAVLVTFLLLDLCLQGVDLGLKRFRDKRWNLILTCVLLITAIDLTIAFCYYPSPVLRFSRPFRSFIPLLSSKPLRRFAFVVLKTIPSIAHLFGCMLVIVACYAISGVALFSHGKYDDPNEIQFSSVQNLNNVPNAVIALIVLVTSENFPDIYSPGMHQSPLLATLYFFSFFVIGAWLFMNLVLAETYRFYRNHHTAKVSHDRAKEQRSLFCCYQMLTEISSQSCLDEATFNTFLSYFVPTLPAEHRTVLFNLLDKNHNNNIELKEFMALIEILRYQITQVWDCVESGDELANWREVLRVGCRRALNITSLKYFRTTCLGISVANLIALLLLSGQPYSLLMHISNWFFLSLMLSENVIIIAARGCKGAWEDRRLDLMLVFLSVPAEIALWGPYLTVSRSLRVLRILPIWGSSRPLLQTLRSSSAIVWHLLFILAAVFFFFATIGLELFSEARIGHPHLFSTGDENFDSFLGACLALFQLSTSNNWQNNLYPAILDTSIWSSLFFIAFYFLVNTVIVNVFAANLISAYTLRESEKTELVKCGHSLFKVVLRRPWERAIISTEMPPFNSAEVASLRLYVQDLENQIQAINQENLKLKSRSASVS